MIRRCTVQSIVTKMALPSNMVKLFINDDQIMIESHQLSIKIKFADINTTAPVAVLRFDVEKAPVKKTEQNSLYQLIIAFPRSSVCKLTRFPSDQPTTTKKVCKPVDKFKRL